MQRERERRMLNAFHFRPKQINANSTGKSLFLLTVFKSHISEQLFRLLGNQCGGQKRVCLWVFWSLICFGRVFNSSQDVVVRTVWDTCPLWNTGCVFHVCLCRRELCCAWHIFFGSLQSAFKKPCWPNRNSKQLMWNHYMLLRITTQLSGVLIRGWSLTGKKQTD